VLKLKDYAPALILAVGYLFVMSGRGQKAVELAAPIEGVLPAVDGYAVHDQKISDEERQVAAMTSYVARAYTRDSVIAFTTLVAYYDRQTRGKAVHSPRNCLPGAGWEIMSGGTQTVTANGVRYTLNRYILKHKASRAVVYYWYQGRGRVVANEYLVKWNLLRDATLRGHTEEALVRVVVPVQPGREPSLSPESAPQVAEASALGESIAKRLIGDVNRILPHDQGNTRKTASAMVSRR
jgi:EpsI family protein